ncbi:Gamma-aminobutyric acid (GABA) B receptor [Seminavis robusta]|uniref:Gamma-aminobutyric acid (GABA) B receptor n=1 Tax=Seminavis robusta TaxID=568900 RepID=A0A9N8DLB4_9STRA|nr:Gamma-aminobutyric acid (GABA) B receptor [Seminavis robusta]|eukprot:Sro205_g086180.1 Gamma-aminobutyric acid (GABA) B receptor (827) ;mRNA; r:21699-24494
MRGQDGTISLLIAVPLTKNNETVVDPGFFHLAAARLAVDHFNSRNASVVQALPELTKHCPITFGHVQAVDTGTNTHGATEAAVRGLRHAEPPDSIVGPYNEIPMLEMSVLATGMQTPMVAPRIVDTNLLQEDRHPYFNQLGADAFSEMNLVAKYLKHLGRNNYVAIVYDYANSAVQKVDILRVVFEDMGFDQVQTFPYTFYFDKKLEADKARGGRGPPESLDLRLVLRKVKDTGYRTIVLMPSRLDKEAALVGPVATELGLDQGDHLWLISGGVDMLSAMEVNRFLQNDTDRVGARFLKGATHVFPYDGYELNPESDFRAHICNHDTTFLQRVQELNPVPGYYEKELQHVVVSNTTDSSPFVQLAVEHTSYLSGVSFMYDAVMSLGLGACNALKKTHQNITNETTAFTGREHLAGIHVLDFLGASGRVKLGSDLGYPGSRQGDTVPYTIANFVPSPNGTGLVIRQAEIINPLSGEWVQVNPYLFADGSSNPPELLRATPDQNYISTPVRAIGMTLFAVALTIILVASVWVVTNRGHSVIVAAQPCFLYVICFSCFIICFCILLSAFDESWGFDEQSLTKVCVLSNWIDFGFGMLCYCAVFTKLWRADLCLRRKTHQIELWRTLWPPALLLLATISILSAGTANGDFAWVRWEVDEVTGASVARCDGGSGNIYGAVISVTLYMIPIVLSGIMAWKTLGIDQTYSEKGVFAVILLHFQGMVVMVPLAIILQGAYPSAQYMINSIFYFTFTTSFMGLIILPKYLLVRRMTKRAIQAEASTDSPASNEVSNEVGRSGDATTNANATGSASGTPQQPSLGSGPRIQIVTFD